MSTPDEGGVPKPEGEESPSEGAEEIEQHDSEDDSGAITPAENVTLQRIAEALPPERRAELFSVIRRESMSHSGWLPTPAFMREYEAVLPGLAERIVAMPEREQAYRQQTTQAIIDRDYRLRSDGQ